MAARPITRADFAKLMAPLGPFPAAPFFAVAVSGGPDSLALALLLKDWLAKRKGRLLALVVDHGLRAQSGKESLGVVRQLEALDIAAKRLVWRGEKPTTSIQEAARAARYRLLAQACRKAGCLYLFLAHQLDDQIETFKLRLASGSGPEGALGMAAISAHPDFLALRPLLSVGKDRLVATVKHRGLEFVEDPSNLDPRFARGRLRLEKVGGGEKAKLARHIDMLAKNRAAADLRLAAALAALADVSPAGSIHLITQKAGDEALPGVLREALHALGERGFAPSAQAVAALLEGLKERGAGTLGGCRIIRRPKGLLLVREETHSYPAPWRPLTQKGWNLLVGRAENPGLPGPVLFALPSLWRGGKPISIPHLGVGREKAPIWRPWPPLGGLGAKPGVGRLGVLPGLF